MLSSNKNSRREPYNYAISETGLFVRENKSVCEVFIEGEWVSPETGFGCQMPISATEVHSLILEALKDHYHSDPIYKNRTFPGS